MESLFPIRTIRVISDPKLFHLCSEPGSSGTLNLLCGIYRSILPARWECGVHASVGAIHVSTNLVGGTFQPLESGIQRLDVVTEFIDTNASGKVQAFYRIHVE